MIKCILHTCLCGLVAVGVVAGLGLMWTSPPFQWFQLLGGVFLLVVSVVAGGYILNGWAV